MLGFLLIQSQRAGASAAARLRGARRAARDRRLARRRRPRPTPEGRVEFRDVVFRYCAQAAGRCSTARRSSSSPASASRSWAAPAAASRRSPACSPASTTSSRARRCIDGIDVRDLTLASVRHHVEPRARRGVPVLGVAARQHRLRPPGRVDGRRRRRGPRRAGARLHHGAARRLRHRRRRARLHAVGRAAPTHRHRPHAARQPEDPRARRRDERHRRHHRGRHPRRAAHADAEPHDDHHRPPPVDDQPRRAGAVARRRPHRRLGHARRVDGHRAALLRRAGPRQRRRRRDDGRRRADDDGARPDEPAGHGHDELRRRRPFARCRPTRRPGLPHAGVPGSLAQRSTRCSRPSPSTPNRVIEFDTIEVRPPAVRLAHVPRTAARRPHRRASSWCSSKRSRCRPARSLTQIAIDHGIDKNDYSVVVMATIAFFASIIVSSVATHSRIAFTGRLGEKPDVRAAHPRVHAPAAAVAVASSPTRRPACLMTRMTSDVEALSVCCSKKASSTSPCRC